MKNDITRGQLLTFQKSSRLRVALLSNNIHVALPKLGRAIVQSVAHLFP